MTIYHLIPLLCIARFGWAWSSCTTIRTLTTLDCTDTPTWVYPFPYSACETCSPYLITDVNQLITSYSVGDSGTTNYVAGYWDWNFRPTRTVTVVIQAPQGTETQVQTWAAEPPFTMTGSGTGEGGAQYTFYFPHEVQYVAEEVNGNQSYLVTFTSTSTRTSVFSNIPYVTQSALQTTENPSSALDSGAQPPNGNTWVTSASDSVFTTGPSPSLDTSFSFITSSYRNQGGGASLESGIAGISPLTNSASLNTTRSLSFNSLQSAATGFLSLTNPESINTTLLTSYIGASLSSVSSEGESLSTNIAIGSFSSSVNVFDDTFPSSSRSVYATVSTEASATGSTTSPIVSPNTSSDAERTFQLYIKNNVSSLNQLAVGKSTDGQLVVGGVVEATILSINESTNLVDLDGNLIYFLPKNKRSSSRFRKRQNDDPTLRYAQNPPVDAIMSGFSLQNITLAANTTEGNFTFYTCSENPEAQPIFVVELGKSPGRCFTFDLVTIPPPLNNTDSASSSTAFDDVDQTSKNTANSTATDDLSGKLSATTVDSTTLRFDFAQDSSSRNNLAFNTEASSTEVSHTQASDVQASNTEVSNSNVPNTQISYTGALDTKASNFEASNTEVSNTEASNSAASNSAASNTAASNTEASNTGASNSGVLDTKASNTEASNTELSSMLIDEALSTSSTEASSASTTGISSASSTGALSVLNSEVSSASHAGASSAATIGISSASDTGISSVSYNGALSASNKGTMVGLSSSSTISAANPIVPNPSEVPSATSGKMVETTGNVVSPRSSTTLASLIMDYTSAGSTNDSAIPTRSDNGGISSKTSGETSSDEPPLTASDIRTGTTSSSTSSNTPAPVIIENQGSYVNQGLYYDAPDSEILDVASISRITDSMSVGSCASFCSNYVYFGLLNGNHDQGQAHYGKANDL